VARISVLLIDDSPLFREHMSAWLSRQEGLDVVGTAASAKEGMALAARLCPRVVLMDIDMPEMNGLEATRLLKSRPGAPAVVLLTVHSGPAYQAAAADAGADGIVSKSDLATEVLPSLQRACADDARGEVGR
jgi:DNA-binding NarL/FixJ family response regulator